MNLKIWYPFKPFQVTQNWGNPNPAYAAQFNDPSFKLHNGIDANIGLGSYGKSYSEYPVYCPVEGFRVLRVDYQPNGGGNEMWLISKKPLQMFDQLCYAAMVLCHGKKILVPEGYEPELGELIMIADNTGFSTGIHTHIGVYRGTFDGTNFNKIDTNEATGSFDPSLFLTNAYAVDVATVSTLVKSGLRSVRYYMLG